MSDVTAEQGCTCASVDGYRIKSRACPTHGPTMPQPRPAHEDPLRRTFTREQLDEAVEQARAEVAAEIEAERSKPDDHGRWSKAAYSAALTHAARIARGEVSP